MKTQILSSLALAFLCVLSFSCSTSINAVVDHSKFAHPYSAPLAVLPYQAGPLQPLSEKLGNVLSKLVATDNKKMDLLLLERHEQELKLNSHDDVNEKINDAVKINQNDVVLFFKPTRLEMGNGGFSDIKYLVTAIDAGTGNEVWKAEFHWSGGSFAGPGVIAESICKSLYGRLEGDGVL